MDCAECQFRDDVTEDRLSPVFSELLHISNTTRDILKTTFVSQSRLVCSECISRLTSITKYQHAPNVLLFSITQDHISISKSIKIRTCDEPNRFYLVGIVYHGGFHFTSRIIAPDGSVWFHDGQLGRICQYEKQLEDFDIDKLCICHD